MFDRTDARRPAQVNACFEGGSSRQDEIVAALRQVGLRENQITVIDRPEPEAVTVETAEPSFFDRLKEMFSRDEDKDHDTKRYDLLILTHLGADESLAGPVQEVFRRFDAARVNYYPPAEPEMHVLGGGEAPAEAPPPGSSGTAGEAIERTASTGTPAGATQTAGGAGARVEPGGLDTATTTQTATSGEQGEQVEREEEVVYRGDPTVRVVDSTSQAGGDATRGGSRA